MVKLIIFDIDGVLIDSKDTHYIALNKALNDIAPEFAISKEKHIEIYDGLPTKIKLNMLVKNGLNENLVEKIYKLKQKYTNDLLINTTKKSIKLKYIFSELSNKYILSIATNCINETANNILNNLGIRQYISSVYTNEICKSKPNTEMWLSAMIKHNVSATETLIIEDSYYGRKGAFSSGANLMQINNSNDINLDDIQESINKCNKKLKWKEDINILIPCAGSGSRFANVGYKNPKPLIDVYNLPMIKQVVNNINIEGNLIFVILEKYCKEFNFDKILKVMFPKCKLVICKEQPQGQAASMLAAKDLINSDKPLLLANSDQIINWDSGKFMSDMKKENIDGSILTFKANETRWSYARCEGKMVVETAEKRVISDDATVGIYYWKRGKDFVNSCNEMIKNNDTFNNEFYACPSFNYAIKNGLNIEKYEIAQMFGIGTPEDLKKNYKKIKKLCI